MRLSRSPVGAAGVYSRQWAFMGVERSTRSTKVYRCVVSDKRKKVFTNFTYLWLREAYATLPWLHRSAGRFRGPPFPPRRKPCSLKW